MRSEGYDVRWTDSRVPTGGVSPLPLESIPSSVPVSPRDWALRLSPPAEASAPPGDSRHFAESGKRKSLSVIKRTTMKRSKPGSRPCDCSVDFCSDMTVPPFYKIISVFYLIYTAVDRLLLSSRTNGITKSSAWEYVPGYVDEGLSAATTKKREDFHRMVEDGKAGLPRPCQSQAARHL